MTVTVRYFAVLRDRAGTSFESVTTDAKTVRELVDKLIVDRKLGLPPSLVRIAKNGAFVEDNSLLTDGDEVVLLPPVAGG